MTLSWNYPHTQSISFFVMCSKCHIWDTTSLSGIIYVALAAIYIINFNLSELIHIALWWNSAICSWFMENCFNGSSWWRNQMERISALTGPLCGEFTGDNKGQVTRKIVALDDVIMKLPTYTVDIFLCNVFEMSYLRHNFTFWNYLSFPGGDLHR